MGGSVGRVGFGGFGRSVGFLHTPTFPTQKMAVIIIVSGFGV